MLCLAPSIQIEMPSTDHCFFRSIYVALPARNAEKRGSSQSMTVFQLPLRSRPSRS